MIIETRFVLPEWAAPCCDDEDDEQWAEVDHGYYVSDRGRIWSGRSQKFLKPKRLDRHGHVGITIRNGGETYYKYLHRLIAEEFIPNPNGFPIVRHLNDNPADNHVDNLAWGTQKDNMHDCYENGHYYYPSDEDREKGFEKIRTPLIATDLETGETFWFRGQCEASRALKIHQANIWKVLHGERKSAGGYTFEWE